MRPVSVGLAAIYCSEDNPVWAETRCATYSLRTQNQSKSPSSLLSLSIKQCFRFKPKIQSQFGRTWYTDWNRALPHVPW